jgi:site-specific DNA-cytosine methylase
MTPNRNSQKEDLRHLGVSVGGKKIIDLFSGTGALSMPFVEAGYAPILHVEVDAVKRRILESNFAGFDVYCAYDIRDISMLPVSHM